MTTTAPLRAARPDPADLRVGQYLRVSKAKDRQKIKSVTEQAAENAAPAAEQSWTITRTYTDSNRSASRHRRHGAIREDFDQLLADLEAGELDVLIMWAANRGSREVEEWIKLIKLAERHGTIFYITTHDRSYDPRVPRDRKTLLEDAVEAEYDVAKSVIDVRRALAAAARDGKPHGSVPYGYERIYDPITRELVEQRAKEPEASAVRLIYELLARGTSLNVIVRTLNGEGGYPAPKGKRWVATGVRKVALSETYIGKRNHKGTITDAVWKGLVSEATFYAVKRILTDPKRRNSQVRPGAVVYLLSFIVRCGECGSLMWVRAYSSEPNKSPTYVCSGRDPSAGGDMGSQGRGHVSINRDVLDKYITKMVFGRLYADWEMFTANEDSADVEVLAARDEIAELEDRKRAVGMQVALGKVSADMLAIIEPEIDAQIAAARKREQRAQTPPLLRWIFDGPRDELPARWEAAPMSARREVIKTLFSSITIKRRPPGAWSRVDPLVEERTDVEWRDVAAPLDTAH